MKTRLMPYPLAIALAGCIGAAFLSQEGPRETGEAALKDRDWAKAEKLLGDALASAKDGQDEIHYLIAIAQQNAGRHDAAIATLDRLVKDHPASTLRMKALFRKADVRAAKREFELAAAGYDAQVAALTAPERRRQIAMVYVDAGREFLAPKDPKDLTFVADYPAAHKLLVKSLEIEALGADEESVRADIIACELKGNLPRPALLKSCETFLEKFPKSAKLDDVLFAYGAALRDTGRLWEAKKAWLRIAAASPRAPEGLLAAALLHVAADGRTATLEELRRALPLLRRTAKEFPASEQGLIAAHLVGVALSRYEALYADAILELTAFVDAHPKDVRAPEALLLVAQIHRMSQDGTKAIATLEDFLKRFADSPRWTEVRQQIADVRHDRANSAFTRKDWPAARAAAQEFLDLHPTDARAPSMAYRVGEALKEEKKFAEAVAVWMKVATKYPSHNEARYAAAELLASELDDFETALKELPKVAGNMQNVAQELLRKLQAKSLTIKSERVFKSGEAPTVKLTVRNLESVKLRFWTLDLKDYFEKKASTAGLQALEVAVIAPDKEWEHAVKDFKRYKETQLDIELPKKDPGAYIVTAGAGTQEATTVVLVSDLALIARAGRKGATVLVQDQRTGAAVPDASIRTAADGKHLKAWTKETTASQLSFLVESKGHLAFRDLNVSWLPAPPERAPAALVLTDRRLYARGEEVRLRIIARDAAEGAYAVPKEKKYRVTAVSAQGVAFHETEVALTRFGTAGASFRLLDGLAGQIRIDVFEMSKPQEKLVGSAHVTVGEAARRGVGFDFLMDDKNYFAGDDIDVTVVLRDAWGRPMPGRRVLVRTPADAVARERMTGADGTFAVELRETEQNYLTGAAFIEVEHEGVRDAHIVPLKPRGVFLAYEEASRVYEPVPTGDEKTLMLTAKRADDAPVSRAFRYSVVRKNVAGERTLVASGDIATDKDGKATLKFTPKEGGPHIVTVESKDEDGLPISVQTEITAVDDKDDQKVRLLSATDEFLPGQAMEFTLLSRLEKGLAFVTVEGEKIEQTVHVMLEKGKTAIKLGPPPATTRDFTVTVLMMQAGKFHVDIRDFRIKGPEITLAADKKEYRPGEEATVRVTAKPGSEVVLIAAEYVTAGVNVHAFNPTRLKPYFTGDSSAATAFEGQTAQIDVQVIQALEQLKHLETEGGARVMLDHRRVFGAATTKQDTETETLSLGRSNLLARGGGGGRYGGRFGGKQAGGLSRTDPVPLLVAVAETDAAGLATFTFRLPQGWGRYTVTAWAVDSSNAIATQSIEIKARAPVTVVFRAPESAVEGESTSVVALLTNHTAQEQQATLTFGGADAVVKVPARSTLERTFPWVASASAAFAMDGIRQEQPVALRPKGPVAYVEAGGAFAAKTEIQVAGEGKLRVRVATGPAAFLESLAEGRDPLTSASDASARLIALIARHRYAKTDGVKLAVMEFSARRAAGLTDAATQDAAWPVLLYLAAAEAKAAELPIMSDLKARFSQATHDDVKALMLFALARGGEAQYGYIHRLWRAADTLSPRALACTALALNAVNKPEEAKAAVDRLARAVKIDHWDAVAIPVPDSSNTAYATTALAAFAMAEIDPAHALLPKVRAWLLGRSPSTPFERAALALALQSTPDKSDVKEIRVGGQVVTGFADVAVSSAIVEPVGAGTYYALARRETAKAPVPSIRTNGWPALVVEGVTVPGGNVAVEEPVKNPSMARVAAGQSFRVMYELTVAGPTTDYHVVELPWVTGLRTDGAPMRHLLPPQTEKERKFTLAHAAYADAPGSYPEIEVLAAGAEFTQGRQMTHGERLGAGRIRFAKKQWRETRDTLAPLFEKGTLQNAPMIEAARMLVHSAVELGEHETVVRYFEVLKEKSPAEVVPFDKIRGVGRAYAAMKEHERAMQVHAGTCDAYFLQEANLAGTLEEMGRSRAAADWMKRLLRDHPDTTLNREMLFGFGQRLYGLAGGAREPAVKDKKKLTRSEMLAEAAAALELHLAWFPVDPEGDRVALSLGGAYLEAQKNDLAGEVARKAAVRHPKSRHLDSFDYIQAVALFARKKFAESLLLCDRLEVFDYAKDANPGPAIMRDQAALMKAQIYHAKGELDKALENYKKVRETSPDAARSIAFIEREAIAVPELTLAALAKPAELELEYAGVAEAQVRAYKVDLTVLALRRKGLADAASIEVAGIKPVFEKSFKLDHPNARRRERQKLVLELKDPGAYVVGVKAGDFFASGLVLRSDLTMTVQEERDGNVRVNIANIATGGFEEGVKVTIFGTTDPKIASQRTDLRGVWESKVSGGLAVVVAEKGGHVAMYRGQTMHTVPPTAGKPQAPAVPQQQEMQDFLQKLNTDKGELYFENNRRRQDGVEVERTKR